MMNIQIRVGLFSATGERLIEANAFTAADVVPSGQRSPFGILFTSPPSDWASSQVTIIRGEAAGALVNSYVPITVTHSEGQVSSPHFQVSGTVQNSSAGQAVGSVRVIATTYDTEGLVTGFRQGSALIADTLTPGSTAPFTLQLNFHGDTLADFSVIALGNTPSE